MVLLFQWFLAVSVLSDTGEKCRNETDNYVKTERSVGLFGSWPLLSS